MPIIPTTKCLFLCDGYTSVEAGKITLHGLFHTIRALDGFTFVKDEFCVYMEMGNGLGTLPFRLEIRSGVSDELIHESKAMQLHFKDRHSVLQVVVRIQKCRFEQPGEYILNLICDNRWLGDTVIQLR
jgi:hypothetical protein